MRGWCTRRRYFETAEWSGIPPQWWFGGGTDITPSYVYDEDMKHFHGTYKAVCDRHDPAYYEKFRQWCAPPCLCCLPFSRQNPRPLPLRDSRTQISAMRAHGSEV